MIERKFYNAKLANDIFTDTIIIIVYVTNFTDNKLVPLSNETCSGLSDVRYNVVSGQALRSDMNWATAYDRRIRCL